MCDCGKVVTVITDSLTSGHTKSCGCLANRMDDDDLIGRRFGKLLVIGLNPVRQKSPSGQTSRRWDCVCDCGNTATVITESLVGGHTNSCGCMRGFGGFKPDRKLMSNNTSGHRGVSWCSSRGKWHAYIGIKGRRISLGSYDNINEAVKAREKAEDEYFTPVLEENVNFFGTNKENNLA